MTTIHDNSNSAESSALLHERNQSSLDSGRQTVSEGHAPKVRKPYTITKQRERWTEEEHKKFLEALKLYGRAWRKIEEHVGTKTAVQIRSHAQKFFSKVVRESNSIDSCPIKPTEIPPPRPKRKPLHPYPRKLVIPMTKDAPLQDQSRKSASPYSSLDQENQSPTTVLSAGDAFGSSNSSPRDGSSSPLSAQCAVQEDVSRLDKPVSMKLEPLTMDATSPKILKIFGKTVLLGSSEKKAGLSSQYLKRELSTNSDEGSQNIPSSMEVGPSAPMPLRAFCGGVPLPLVRFEHLNPMKPESKELENKKQASVNAPYNCPAEMTQSHQCSLEFTSSLSAKLKRTSSENYTRAFVPYKRSLSERPTQSAKMINDECDRPRTRLCL